MISNNFKKTIKNTLKKDYNIDCYRISTDPYQNAYNQNYTIHCSFAGVKFTLQLIIDLCLTDMPSDRYSFTVVSEERYIHSIVTMMDNSRSDLINSSMSEVRNLFSYLNPCYTFRLEHQKIYMISGTYLVGSSCFEIKTIKSKISTVSVIKFNNSTDKEKACIRLNIVDKNIFVKPLHDYYNNTIFQVGSVLEDDKMDIFKANFAKCILLYFNDNSDDHNDIIDNYIDLDYSDMKRYLLINEMEKI